MILNPSDATFQQVVQPLLTDAYEIVTARDARRAKSE